MGGLKLVSCIVLMGAVFSVSANADTVKTRKHIKLAKNSPKAEAVRSPDSAPTSYSNTSSRPSASSRSGNIGLGAMFGEPTGITFKSWTSNSTAFDIGLTYSFSHFFEILADYLWHFPHAFSSGRSQLASELVPYIGVGGEVFFDTDSTPNRTIRGSNSSNAGFGARIPIGLEFLPHAAPVGIFAELVPGLALAPNVFGFLEGVVGARFYF